MPLQQFLQAVEKRFNRLKIIGTLNYSVITSCLLFAFSSCQSKSNAPSVYVEDFRSIHQNDDEVIQEAIDEAGPSGTIYFEPGREYYIRNSIRVKQSQILVGNNATMKRATQTFSFLSQPCTSTSDSLIIDSIPKGWRVGDQLQLLNGDSHFNSNPYTDSRRLPNIITRIDDNKIFVSSPVGASLNGGVTWAKGTVVRKVYTMLRGDSIQYRSAPFTVLNMNFNGNKRENDLNYYWNVNSTIFVRGRGSKIEGCNFYDIPNENIVGHGIYVSNCQAEVLNGSFIHFSGNDTAIGAVQKHSVVTGNYVNRVCLLTTATTGHSEAAFTTSNNGGFATISDNRVYNCGSAIIGFIDAPYDTADAGKSEIIMTGNIFRNCAKIVYDFASVKTGQKPSTDIYFADNIFSNCGTNDWTKMHFRDYDGFKIGNNSLTNGTTWKY